MPFGIATTSMHAARALAGTTAAAAVLLTAAAPAPADTGGLYPSSPARVTSIDCLSSCADLRSARPNSLVRLRGRDMESVRNVTFLGGRGNRDDVTVRAARARTRSVDVRVPGRAVSGRVRTRNGDGAPSQPSRAILAIERGRSAGPLDVRVGARRVFVGGRAAQLTLMVTEERPLDVGVQLVGLADGVTVAQWSLGTVPAHEPRSVAWDGKVAGAAAPEGRYEFRVFAAPAGANAAQAQGGAPLAAEAFHLLAHRFPVRGKYGYGEFAATFGGGRGHQGQDVFADCGTPLVAARGGIVRFKAFQSRAGNYVVIAGDDGVDYAYMHLRAPSPLKKGDKVATGRRIGEVGDTGRASGCHLHFEMWSAPGWYEGGKPFDPLPALRQWEAAERGASSASRR